MEGQWRPIYELHFLSGALAGEGCNVQFHIGNFQELPDRRSQVARFHNCRVVLVGHKFQRYYMWTVDLDHLGRHPDYPEQRRLFLPF